MKTKLLSVVLCLLLGTTSTKAFLGNDGPQASPALPPQPIAYLKMGGGLTPPDSPISMKVEITTDGKITLFKYYYDYKTQKKKEVQVTVMVLGAEALGNLVSAVVKIKPGELVDQNLNEPGCMDAPGYEYYAGLGKDIAIGAKIDCKEKNKTNSTYNEEIVKSVLDSALDIASRLGLTR